MRFFALFIVSLLGLAQAKQHLRRQPNARQLQYTDNVPLDVEMSIRVADSAKNIQPTDQDYDAVAMAFQTWFHANSVDLFLNNPKYASLTYESTTCQWNRDKTTFTPADAEYQHTVSLSCHSAFAADSATNMISSLALAQESSANFAQSLQTFIPDYLAPMSPANSPFRSSRFINFKFMPAGSLVLPTNPPVPGLPTTPPTTPPQQPGKKNIPFTIQWTLTLNKDEKDRQPTMREYDAFVVQNKRWISDIFAAEFPENNAAGLAHYTGVISADLKTSSRNTAERQHVMTIEMRAEFESKDGKPYPKMTEWVMALRKHGIDSFAPYLNNGAYIFRNPSFIGWEVLYR